MRIAVAVSLLLAVIGVAGGLAAGLVYRSASAAADAEARALDDFPWPAVAEVGAPPVLEVSDPHSLVRTVTVVFTAYDEQSDRKPEEPVRDRVIGAAIDAAGDAAARQHCRRVPVPIMIRFRRVAPDAHGVERLQAAFRWRLEPLDAPQS